MYILSLGILSSNVSVLMSFFTVKIEEKYTLRTVPISCSTTQSWPLWFLRDPILSQVTLFPLMWSSISTCYILQTNVKIDNSRLLLRLNIQIFTNLSPMKSFCNSRMVYVRSWYIIWSFLIQVASQTGNGFNLTRSPSPCEINGIRFLALSASAMFLFSNILWVFLISLPKNEFVQVCTGRKQ